MCGLLGCVRRAVATRIAALAGLSPISVLPAVALADAEQDRDTWEPDELNSSHLLWDSMIVPSPGSSSSPTPSPGEGHPSTRPDWTAPPTR